MSQNDDSRWRGYVALAILGSLVGIHLWVRSLNAPQEASRNDKPVEKIAIDPDIDPKLPPAERDRRMREKALRKMMDQQTADLRKQAAAALAQGNYQVAADLYRKCLKIDPSSEEAKTGLFNATDARAFAEHFGRGQEALAMGDLETAFFEFDKARELKTADPEVASMLVQTKLQILLRDAHRAEGEQRWDDAVACYDQAQKLKDDPQIAETLRNLKDTVVAEATKKRRADYGKLLSQADDLERDEKTDAAMEAYRKAKAEGSALGEETGFIDRKIALCGEKSREYEELANHWIKKAEECMAQEKYDEALDSLGKCPANIGAEMKKKIADTRRDCENRRMRKEMIEIPAGEFVMGGVNVGDTGLVPQRRVHLKRFYIDRTEVTHRQYQAFLEATGYAPPEYWKGKTPPRGTEEVPVVAVAYEDALAYATWKGKRLPSEEEWEKAARGTDGRTFPWGNAFDAMKCNSMALKAGKSLPMPVSSFPKGASPYGCTDMAGNAMEWTSTEAPPSADAGRVKIFRILKGGSFLFNETMCQCGARLAENPTLRLMGVGFRCAKDAE